MAEIGTDNRGVPVGSAVIGQGQVPSAGTQVQDRRIARRPNFADGAPAPVDVDAQREQVVQEIIARGDFAEHSSYTRLRFVDTHSTLGRGQSRLPAINTAPNPCMITA